ncbi:MAG: CdaR family protein [Bacillota bacterium]|nr:CdaR family protein [Bacillota bacterium]
MERIKNNWTAKLLALGMSILLWGYVNIQRNPQLDEIYRNVPVEVIGLADNLVITNKPPNVQVRLAGSRTSLAAVSQREIRAYVDLQEAVLGSNLVPINITAPNGVEIVSVTPAQVNLYVDQILEERWPVSVRFKGELPEGYETLETQVRPDFVFLRGNSELLNEVKDVFVTVDLMAEQPDNNIFNLTVEVISQANQLITPSLGVNPTWVEVSVPIQQVTGQKTVPVEINTLGQVAAGYEIRAIEVNPDTAVISGGGAALEQIEALILAVDVEGLAETTTIAANPILPEGVAEVEPTEFLVTVSVATIDTLPQN